MIAASVPLEIATPGQPIRLTDALDLYIHLISLPLQLFM